MDKLLSMYGACEMSPAYIRLDRTAANTLRDRLQAVAPEHFLELEALANAYGASATIEGFVNGWAWAQGTARECLELRKLPELSSDYGPEKRCGSCRWFVQHYRYTGAAPWYEPVGCGHCTGPQRQKNLERNPARRGCVHWEVKPDAKAV